MYRLTVLNPEVAHDVKAIAGATRPAELKDLVVGFVDNSKQNADLFIERLRTMMRERYGIAPGVRVRKQAPKDELTDADLAALKGCTAVVQCYGD